MSAPCRWRRFTPRPSWEPPNSRARPTRRCKNSPRLSIRCSTRFLSWKPCWAAALVSHDEKSKLLDRVFGGRLSPLVVDFLKVISRHGRLDIVRSVHHQVLELYDELRGRIRVQLSTATAVSDELSTSLRGALQKLLGGEPAVEPAVDPSLDRRHRAARRRHGLRRLGRHAIATGSRADDRQERP